MIVKNVKLTNFRNYEEGAFEFADGLNVIFGENAVGKTNLVESVYLAALGKSPRAVKDKELVRWAAAEARVTVEVQTGLAEYLLEIYLDDKGKKHVFINKIPVKRLSELIGIINLVFFSPEELKMIKEAPAERRRFMDIYLSQRKKTYLYALSRYNKILAQRNKSIKTMRDKAALAGILPVWDVQLAKEGAIVIKNRYQFLDKLKTTASEKHSALSDGKENISLFYESLVPDAETKEIEAELLKIYGDSVERDMALGFTTAGPHRDDIYVELDGRDIKKYGSQGQQRTAALSLKLAEAALFKEEANEPPVIILDDVLSELDANRQKKLVREAANYQTLITCTAYNEDKNLVSKFIEVKK